MILDEFANTASAGSIIAFHRHSGDLKVYKGNRKFIHVDVDPGQLGKNIMPDLGICADAKLTLQALLDEIRRRKIKPQPSKMDIAQIRTKLERKTDYENTPIKPQRVFKELNEFFGPETLFVTCIGLNQIWSGQLQKITKPRHYLDCGGAGPLGWDMPASIGAKVARPDKQVVVEGMDVVDKIKDVPTTTQGQFENVPETPVVILSIKRVEQS